MANSLLPSLVVARSSNVCSQGESSCGLFPLCFSGVVLKLLFINAFCWDTWSHTSHTLAYGCCRAPDSALLTLQLVHTCWLLPVAQSLLKKVGGVHLLDGTHAQSSCNSRVCISLLRMKTRTVSTRAGNGCQKNESCHVLNTVHSAPLPAHEAGVDPSLTPLTAASHGVRSPHIFTFTHRQLGRGQR